jgi:glyoxylase I family protein
MPALHHTAICVRDVDASLRFWRDGLGFELLMDARFEGDWPTLLRAPSRALRSVFLGDPAGPQAGIVELVDLGPVPDGPRAGAQATTGVLVLSVFTDVAAAIERLAALALGGEPRSIEAHGVAMAVVVDPDGVLVELVDTDAARNLDELARGSDA